VAVCLADGSGFGACEGQALPAEDLCETPADEDCNGVIAPCLTPWTNFFGPDAAPIGMAVDLEGRVTVAALFYGTVQVGNTILSAPPLTAEFFVAQLSPTGQIEWVTPIHHGGEFVGATGSVVLSGGGIVVAGGAMTDISAGPLDLPGQGGFVLKLDAQGNPLWGMRTGHYGNRAAASPSGDIFVSGWQDCTQPPETDFGCDAKASVLKLDTNGNVQYSTPIGLFDQWVRPFGIGVTSQGEVFVSGILYGALDLAGTTVEEYNGGIFLAKLDASGTPQWVRSFSDTTNGGWIPAYSYFYGAGSLVAGVQLAPNATAFELGVAPNDDAVVTGLMSESVAFGDPPTTAPEPLTVFYAAFNTEGEHVWSRTAGGPVPNIPPAIAITPWGELLTAAFAQDIPGGPSGTLDFGGGPLPFGVGVGHLAGDGSHIASLGLPATWIDSWLAVGAAPGGVCVTGKAFEPIQIGGDSSTGMFLACFLL
jgi:hypothetical protein